MRKLKLSFLAILIIGLISSCKKDDKNENENNGAILNSNTIIVDSVKGTYLTYYDTTKIGFNKGAPITDEIGIGSIIVSGPQTLAPNGFLRRVLRADTISGKVMYTTEFAKLTDALDKGTFNVSSSFDPSEVVPIDSSVTISALKKESELFQFLVQAEIKDASNNKLDVSITLNMTPNFSLDCSIDHGLNASALLNLDGDWKIESTTSTEINLGEFRKELFRPRNIATQTIWIPTTIGIPFPVVLREDFVVVLVGSASIDGSITLSVRAEYTSKLGVEYNHGFTPIHQFNSGIPTPYVSAEVTANGRIGIWPAVRVYAYDDDIGRIDIGPEGYLAATASISTSGNVCRLDYGVDLKISFAAPIFTDDTYDPNPLSLYSPHTLVSNFCGGGSPCSDFSASTTVNNTSITANPTGGTSPYTYSWSNGGTTKTISGLSNGTYTVTATDNEGCTAVASGTVGVDPCLSNPVSVNVNESGTSITANPSGGTTPYSYSWSNGKTTQTISGLSNGTYHVTVTDAGGCTATGDGTVGVDPCQTNPVSVSADVSGTSITATISGGTSPYDYEWSNGSTTQTISGLSPGTYRVTVTDDNGCTDTDSGTIGSPSFPMIIYNSGNQNNRVRSSRDSTNVNNIITSIAPGKKVVAKDQINGWYLIDIPYDGSSSPKEGWTFGGPTYMQPSSGNCVLVTGTNLRIRDAAGGNILWINPSNSGNYTNAYTDIDQHYVYTSTTISGSYTWYRIDLPNFIYGCSGCSTSITTGWISGQYSAPGNCQ